MNLSNKQTHGRSKNFYLPNELDEKLKKVVTELDISFSELIRNALNEYIAKLEKEQIEKEITTACEFYYDKDRELAKDWDPASPEI